MALSIPNVFAVLGRCGRNGYVLNQCQALQGVPVTELIALSYVKAPWITGLVSSYDSNIRSETGSMSSWVQAVNTVLQQLVAAQDPAYGTSLQASVSYLYQAMLASGDTVLQYTVGSSVAADVGNVGNGSVFVTLVRGDGYSLQNTIPEAATLLITADSYTGGATVGQEPWQLTGAPNVSSLGTGVGVGLWDWDNPQGSGASVSGNCISANDQTNAGGNWLTNGNFETWTGGTPVLSNWNLSIGTWGTSIQQSNTPLGGTYCVQFNTAGSVLNTLTTQFGSTATSGATAGTNVAISPYRGYAANLWLKAAGVISGGVLTVSFVDSADTVINDQKGTANSTTIALTAASTNWTPHAIAFRAPVVLPADGIVRLKIKMTTALAGAALLMDQAAFTAPPSAFYPGGPVVAVFSNPAAPFEAAPEPDGWTVTLTNNFGGASNHASFQTLANRVWGIPGLILPYAASGFETLSDSLITGV